MIRVEEQGDVRTVTLDRPAARNALTPDALLDLADAVTGTDCPVVYLAGAGEAFCAGADLTTVAEIAADGTEAAAAFARRGQETMTAIETADAVVVAGVDGPARGGGVELAVACDVRAATPTATFAETGVSLGLFGAWGGTARLPELVGTGNALDVSLSGRAVGAREARRMGLVQRVTDRPREVAAEIAANDASALRAVKELVRDDRDQARQEAAERDAFARLLADHAAALSEYRKR